MMQERGAYSHSWEDRGDGWGSGNGSGGSGWGYSNDSHYGRGRGRGRGGSRGHRGSYRGQHGSGYNGYSSDLRHYDNHRGHSNNEWNNNNNNNYNNRPSSGGNGGQRSSSWRHPQQERRYQNYDEWPSTSTSQISPTTPSSTSSTTSDLKHYKEKAIGKYEQYSYISRQLGTDQENSLKSFQVQEDLYRQLLQDITDLDLFSYPKTLTIPNEWTPAKQSTLLATFRKLRESIFATQRSDEFAITVYETSAYLSLALSDDQEFTKSLYTLITDLYPTRDAPPSTTTTPYTIPAFLYIFHLLDTHSHRNSHTLLQHFQELNAWPWFISIPSNTRLLQDFWELITAYFRADWIQYRTVLSSLLDQTEWAVTKKLGELTNRFRKQVFESLVMKSYMQVSKEFLESDVLFLKSDDDEGLFSEPIEDWLIPYLNDSEKKWSKNVVLENNVIIFKKHS